MLRNSTEVFISQSMSKRFLDALEDLIGNPRTNPVVRERVMEILAAAAYAQSEFTSFITVMEAYHFPLPSSCHGPSLTGRRHLQKARVHGTTGRDSGDCGGS
jgi:hypothetical protein